MRAEQVISVDSSAIERMDSAIVLRRSATASPFVWLNIICLDAPIVAVIWQSLFAHEFHLLVAAPERVALFLTAWLIYLADRFADALALRSTDASSLREKFCRRHLRAWLVVLALAAASDAFVILRYLSLHAIAAGVAIGFFSVCYLAINYWRGGVWHFLPVKELCVGFLFAFGTVAVFFSQRAAMTSGFLATFSLFGTLCFLNCLSIAVWECDLDRAQKKHSIATRWPFSGAWLKWIALLLVVLAASLSLAGKAAPQATGCIIASAILLAGLDFGREKISRDVRTALADLVLLTPLVTLLFAW